MFRHPSGPFLGLEFRNRHWPEHGSDRSTHPTPPIVTMTRATTPAEARLLKGSLRALSRSNLPIYVGEGGSETDFVERVKKLPNVHLCRPAPGQRVTLVNQLRNAFARASAIGSEYLLYTEPDKRAFFAAGLRTLAASLARPERARAGIVLAARTPESFATFPAGQRAAETMMNGLCAEAFGREGDYTYGPMLIHHRLVGHLENLTEDAGWGWRFFLMAIAHQLGLEIDFCPVPDRCPRPQRAEDDAQSRRYRLHQLVQNVAGLSNGWICLLHAPLGMESAG
jgi:hypothetical protein